MSMEGSRAMCVVSPRKLHALLLVTIVILAACTSLVSAEHWAVIVAGSKGYGNYRHQSDACHAYHVVRRHGIPKENVILMMYDDAANATKNPFPGKLFNKPTNKSADAIDVYAGCHVDYRGADVTPENFMSVLLGDAKATNGKKVLQSNGDDRVFVNFVDHGARGYVMFPEGQMLTSKQITKTMTTMFTQKKYKELVFYVEACDSGSMFWSRPMAHINAFVTTAANGWEPSFGAYCPPMDYIDGVPLNTCLGDLYSVNWMEDSDRTDLSSETLGQQFALVKKETKGKSHVEQYGSTGIRKEIVGDFQSNYDITSQNEQSQGEKKTAAPATAEDENSVDKSAVSAHDIPLVLAFYEYLRSSPGDTLLREGFASQLMQEIQGRQRADQLFHAIRSTYATFYGEELQTAQKQTSAQEETDASAVLELFAQLVATTAYGATAQKQDDLPRGFTSYSLQYSGQLTDLWVSLGGDQERVARVLKCAIHKDCPRLEDPAVVA